MLGAQAINSGLTIEVVIRTSFDSACIFINLIGMM